MKTGAFLSIFFVGTFCLADSFVNLPLFIVTKEINKNTVQYEVGVNSKCEFDGASPFIIYWKMADGTTEALNGIELTVYGLNIRQQDLNNAIIEVKAFASRNIQLLLNVKLKTDSFGACVASANTDFFVANEMVMFKSAHLQKFNGVFIQQPTEVVLNGLLGTLEFHKTLSF